MADHIRYNVSCELIDEYTQNVTFSDDDSADLIPDVTGTKLQRHHPKVGKSLGSSVNSATAITVGTPQTIVGYGGTTNGLADLVEADETGQSKTTLGVAETDYELVFIKHTGFKVKEEGASPVELGDATTDNLEIYIENPSTTFNKICRLVPGASIVLPLVETEASCTFGVLGTGIDHIAVEYLLVKGS